ncbi:MAG: REP-associated tyrosine transposase [Opitutaceae bacterium]
MPPSHSIAVIKYSHLPHLQSFARYPIVFVTAVTHNRRSILANAGSFEILTAIWQRSSDVDGWFVGAYLLMPDHVHVFARPALEAKTLAQWMETWKSLSSRRLSHALETLPPLWQRDYFDRFLRSSADYTDKWDYVTTNPIRKKLCERPEDWPWKGRLFDLSF